MGKRHLEKLILNFTSVLVVDPRAQELAEEFRLFKNDHFDDQVSFVEDMSQISISDRKTSALISNWAPDHVDTVFSLMGKGVRRFAVEKPLADSLGDIERLELLVKENKIDFVMNMPWRRSSLFPRLQEYARLSELGRPKRVIAQLGAAGFSEIGIHVLDFSGLFLDSEPQKVTSTLFDSKINPRNSNLSYFGGTAVYDYDDMNQLVISLHNQIRTAGKVFFEWEYGYAELDLSSGLVTGRKVEDLQDLRLKPANRTAEASISALITEDIWAESDEDPFIYEFLRGSQNTDFAGIAASKNLIAALEANAQGRILTLSRLSEECEVSTRWKIT